MLLNADARRLTVSRALGIVTMQDLGRVGFMHQAIPNGGAMVPELLIAANRAVSNRDDTPAVEVMGTLVVLAQTEIMVSVDGERARVLRPGEELAIAPVRRVGYLAVRGGLHLPPGHMLKKGEAIASRYEPEVTRDPPGLPGAGPVRIVPGPDHESFSRDAIDALTAQPYRISESSDRVGTRLTGAKISRVGAPERSRPMVRGAIEVPGDGQPIVLGPEHPTTGGYPLVAVIATSDLGRFFSIPLGGTVRFIVC